MRGRGCGGNAGLRRGGHGSGPRARCLNQNGLLYTNGNIEQLLYTRHENGKARRRGHYTPVQKRTPADDEAFRRALSAMLDEGKKNE
nr:DUF188 domain-containing protein [Ruthenibacterium lactatiformans]